MKLNKLSKVSIVVPVYNVSQYLRVCIDSLINQTYPNCEIILVDDGSKDDSGEICDEYALKYSNINVLHKQNGGLSDARNSGLKMCTGEFVMFIDSDDYVSENLVERLIDKYKETNADIVICDYKDVWDDKYNFSQEKANYSISVMSNIEAVKVLIFGEKHGMVPAWNKLYKKELLNEKELYPIGKIHEDCYTTYKLMLKADKICYINEKLYAYRHRCGSITTNINLDKENDIIYAADEMCNELINVFPEDKFIFKYIKIMYNLQYSSNVKKIGQRKYLRLPQENISNSKYKDNVYLNKTRKIRCYLLINFPIIFILINKLKFK